MFLHRQQKQLLSQLSSCFTAVLWPAIKHSFPEGGRLHWTWKWDRCQIPVQGQRLGNQAMQCSEHRSTYIYFHCKNNSEFFSLDSVQLFPIFLLLPHCGELSTFNSSPSYCFGTLILIPIQFFHLAHSSCPQAVMLEQYRSCACKGGKKPLRTLISQAATARAALFIKP